MMGRGCAIRAIVGMPYTLESLYEAHSKTIYWAAYGVLHDRELAADAMQNAFLSAYRNRQTLDQMTEPQCRAWLYRCAVNSSIDMLRRNKRSIPTEDAGSHTATEDLGPEEQAERNERRKAVREAMDNLPEKYREPLYLYYFADLDYTQIAETLNMNTGTLKSRMSRGRAMMEKALRKEGGHFA